MRAIIQRVTSACVRVDGNVISSIERGLCVLVGIHRDDTHEDIEFVFVVYIISSLQIIHHFSVRKILNTRLFDGDNEKRWDKSVKDLQFGVLCVSQVD
jgi:D-tyrosyl-tRNA(Tyr) deacylase